MRDKAFRRWQEEKKKKKVRKYWVCSRWPITGNRLDWTQASGPTDDPAIIGAVAHTPAACSCTMCGNPRKHFNQITMQERKADLGWEEAA